MKIEAKTKECRKPEIAVNSPLPFLRSEAFRHTRYAENRGDEAAVDQGVETFIGR
jgi:hypothetical protein